MIGRSRFCDIHHGILLRAAAHRSGSVIPRPRPAVVALRHQKSVESHQPRKRSDTIGNSQVNDVLRAHQRGADEGQPSRAALHTGIFQIGAAHILYNLSSGIPFRDRYAGQPVRQRISHCIFIDISRESQLVPHLMQGCVDPALGSYDVHREENIEYRKQKKRQGKGGLQRHRASFAGEDKRRPFYPSE